MAKLSICLSCLLWLSYLVTGTSCVTNQKVSALLKGGSAKRSKAGGGASWQSKNPISANCNKQWKEPWQEKKSPASGTTADCPSNAASSWSPKPPVQWTKNHYSNKHSSASSTSSVDSVDSDSATESWSRSSPNIEPIDTVSASESNQSIALKPVSKINLSKAMVLELDNVTKSIDAQGRNLVILGNNNQITLTGSGQKCLLSGSNNQVAGNDIGYFEVKGENNIVDIDSLRGATIFGSENRIEWKNADLLATSVKVDGFNNQINEP